MKGLSVPNSYNDELILLAEEYTRENMTDNLVCTFVGGSVGRGEADEYSDLDLNFYIASDLDIETSQNILYKNHIIQLDIHTLPDIREIHENPWQFRFLQEAKCLYDPKGIFRSLWNESVSYFGSSDGRNLMKKQAFEIIDQRLKWTEESVQNGELLTASIAANSSWVDSAFCYSYFKYGSLATGSLFSKVEGLKQYQGYRDICFNGRTLKVDGLLESLKMYRSYLRDNYSSNFSLESVQDELALRKAARHMRLAEIENISWQLSGEAFWCYLSVANGKSVEKHFKELPERIQKHLIELGFISYSLEQITSIERFAKEIKNLV
jgi:hypothetical protein